MDSMSLEVATLFPEIECCFYFKEKISKVATLTDLSTGICVVTLCFVSHSLFNLRVSSLKTWIVEPVVEHGK